MEKSYDTPEIIRLNSLEDIERKLKEHGFITRDRQGQFKTLFYKGIYTKGEPAKCSLYGFINTNKYETFAIEVNGKKHNISPDYFKEMQDKKFKYKLGGNFE